MLKYFPTNHVWNPSVDLAIESGARIGEIELEHGDRAEHARLMQETSVALEAPI